MCHPAWARARTAAHHLDDLARLSRVRDRLDREYARPLDADMRQQVDFVRNPIVEQAGLEEVLDLCSWNTGAVAFKSRCTHTIRP